MPTTMRRTSATEEAASYGYKDLLRDSLALLGRKAGENVARMTSGKIKDAELLETALAPAGGMLKIAGTSKLLAGLLRAHKLYARDPYIRGGAGTPSEAMKVAGIHLKSAREAFRETLGVPSKEYGRITDIDWANLGGGTRGLFYPGERRIALNIRTAGKQTPSHEFGHGRQLIPGEGILPSGMSEAEATTALYMYETALSQAARRTGLSAEAFYETVSPIERHARLFGEKVVRSPEKFGDIFRETLEKELGIAEHSLRSLEGEGAVRKVWEKALGKYR